MELESCAGREGLILLMTTNKPSKVHLGQCVGKAQARKQQRRIACCLGSQAPYLKEDLAEERKDDLCRIIWVERVCTEFVSLIWVKSKGKMKYCKRNMSFSGEGAQWPRGEYPFRAGEC